MSSDEVKKRNNERQRKRRAKLKLANEKPFLVRGANGEFDPRVRIFLAVKELAETGELNDEIIKLIARRAETVFPTKVIDRVFMNKEVSDYLTRNRIKEEEYE
ncbi:MAG: hypothetical protein WBC60_04125 [Cognaticolwellia sp.]